MFNLKKVSKKNSNQVKTSLNKSIEATVSQPIMPPNEKTTVTYRTYESERLTVNNTPDMSSLGKQTRPPSPIHFPNVLKSPSNTIKRVGSSSYESRRQLKESQNLNLNYLNDNESTMNLSSKLKSF